MAIIASQQPQKGLCKKTVKALRWFVFLSFALVTLVTLAQAEHQMKMEQGDYSTVSSHSQLTGKSLTTLSLRQ